MKLINIGFSNLIVAERLVTVAAPDSAPMKRLIADAREAGTAVDCSGGKKTKSVLLTDSGHVILSALCTEEIAARIEGKADTEQTEES